MPYLAAVITCSDRVHRGVYEDQSGPILVEGLRHAGFETPMPVVVPDTADAIADAIVNAVRTGARVVMTTGGTGVGPRDVTVEATRPLLDFELPGVAEAIRRRGPAPYAMLSRGIAGVMTCDGNRAFIVNAPGSIGGVSDTMAVVGPAANHIVAQLDGGDHG